MNLDEDKIYIKIIELDKIYSFSIWNHISAKINQSKIWILYWISQHQYGLKQKCCEL
jgi:hypothetical protein